MQGHHYLGALPKISETLRYICTFQDQWAALICFSASALKCFARLSTHRRQRWTQAHKRNQDGYSPAWSHRHRGQRHYRGRTANSVEVGQLYRRWPKCPLPLHRQGKPAHSPSGYLIFLPKPRWTRFRYLWSSWSWSDRNPKNLDHLWTERLSELPTCRTSKGYGPENMTRFRRFAVSIIKSKGVRSVAQKMRELARNTRSVFDYLKMTKNSCAASQALKE